MPIPSFDRFIEPTLRYLAAHPDGARARDVHEAAAAALGLSDADRQERLPSGQQAVYKNRAGWAHDRLKRAGLSTSLRRGFWKLTEAGLAFAAANASALKEPDVQRIAFEFGDVRLRPEAPEQLNDEPSIAQTKEAAATSPDEQLESALAEIRQSVAAELTGALREVSPAFFEALVLDLLHRMGYGTSRADLQRVGRSGDGGIDGIISLDRLGLEKVYVQAKRWQQSVGRPELQAFFGALAGQRARKGVFITTSAFTAQAAEYARSVDGVVLIDGLRLAELMIDHEVGVTLRPLRVPKFDSDYFDEEAG